MSKQNGRKSNQHLTAEKTLTVEENHCFDAPSYSGTELPAKEPESLGGEFMEFVQVAAKPIYPTSNQQHQALETLLHCCIQEKRAIRLISQQIREGANLGQILNTSVELVRQFLQADRTVIYRFSPNRPAKVIAESHLQNCSSMLGFTIAESNFSHNARTTEPERHPYTVGEIETINNIYTCGFDDSYIKLMEFFNIKSLIIAPIRENNPDPNNPNLSGATTTKTWGLLIAHQCDKTREWNPWEIEFISSLTDQLEIAVRQSRLQEQVRQANSQLTTHIQKRTTQLQQSLETESVIKRISDQVKDSLDENEIVQTAVRELTLLLDVDDCNSAIYNEDQTTASILYQYNPNPNSGLGLPVQIADFKEISSQLLTGEPLQFCQLDCTRACLNNSLKFDDAQTSGKGIIPKAILACPIVHGGVIMGDLWLFKNRQEAFSEVEIRLAQLVANHCAIAIRQVRLYQAAQKQVAELEKLNALKDDFLSTVSHELRTPLSNMKMAIQMLAIALNQEKSFFAELAKPEQEKSKVARYYQIVRNECEREIALIEDLLELQQLDTNPTAIAPAIIEMERILDKLAKTFQQKALQYQQNFRVEKPATLPHLVGDPVVVERVLTELLTNACKYTPAGEDITVSVEVSQNRLLLTVANTGVEIPQNELNQIFHKFYRIPKADRWQQGGTGLGLAVVQKLTERMGGKLEVSSLAGTTCFKLDLPVKLSKVEQFSR